MKFKNASGVFIAILILIIMLLTCHTMNLLYPRNTASSNNKFENLINKSTIIPTQYNVITYDNHKLQIPCASQAQIPCKVMQKQCTRSAQNTLSDSEIAILYKQAYEMAGNEVLLRTLIKK